MSLAHALKWSFLGEFAAKSIQPIVFVILAGMLTPVDFGVMSAALMVISFSQVFWEAGMGKALIQRQRDIGHAANAAFLINLALGIVISLLLLAAAQPIARILFQDQRVVRVLQVMTLQILLGSISSVHTALLQKEMDFKKLFWVRFSTISLPGLASIPMAWGGMGYWALVAGTLLGQLAQAILLWRMSHWRPRWDFRVDIVREMGRFSGWVCASGVFAWFYSWADSLIIGMHLGSHNLGLYRTGNQLVATIYSALLTPAMPVIYSRFVRIDRSILSRYLADSVNVIALISIPLSFLLFGLSKIISTTFFGPTWSGLGNVIALMGLSHGISFIFSANGEAFRAADKPNYETIPMAIGVVVFLPVYFYAVKYGLNVFLYARLLSVTLIGALIHTYLAAHATGLSVGVYLRHVALFVVLVVLLHVVPVQYANVELRVIVALIFSVIATVWIVVSNWKSLSGIIAMLVKS